MSTRVLRHVRRNVVSYVAVFLALGGGYAIAAVNGRTIHGCVLNKTHQLLIKQRCARGQTSLSFNQRGLQGPRGRTGPIGPPGQPAPGAWAEVSNAGATNPDATRGISVTHTSAGTYQVTVTAPACSGKLNAPTVTLSDSNPPGGQPSGAFPTAWIALAGLGSFTVYTGDVVNGSFTGSDHPFVIQDVCGS